MTTLQYFAINIENMKRISVPQLSNVVSRARLSQSDSAKLHLPSYKSSCDCPLLSFLVEGGRSGWRKEVPGNSAIA